MSVDEMSPFARSADIVLRLDAADLLSAELIRRVNSTCEQAEDAAPDRAVVVHLGAIDPAGAPSWPGESSVHAVGRWERALRRLERVPAPLVAVVEGTCSGAALEVLLTTDYRIAVHGSRFRLSGGTGSGWPGMAVHRLVHQIGATRTRRMALTGLELSDHEAVAWGVVDETADPTALGDRIRFAIGALTRMPATELAVLRRMVLDAGASSFEDALGAHLAACDRALLRTLVTSGTAEPRQGVQ